MLAKRWYGFIFFCLMIFFLFYPGLHYRWMVWVNLIIMLIIFIVHGSHYIYAYRLHYYLKEDKETPSDQKQMKIKMLKKILWKAYKRIHRLSLLALIMFTIFFFLNWHNLFH